MANDDESALEVPGWTSLWLRGSGGMTVGFSVTGTGWPSGPEERDVFIHARAPEFDAMYDWRLITGDDLGELRRWLDAVVSSDFPDKSVPALTLRRPGIVMDIVAAHGVRVIVELTTVGFPDDPGGFSFDTTLMALRHTAAQIATGGFDDFISPRMQLNNSTPTRFQSLIWDSVGLPPDSQLNGVVTTDDDHLDPPGNMAMLRGVAFHPDCDAELELERLRILAPGSVATLLGTLPSGERFGVLVQQSLPAMDDEWLSYWGGEVPLGRGGVPAGDPWDWWMSASVEVLADLRDFYKLQFLEATQWAQADAPFSQSVGLAWLPPVMIAQHLDQAYEDSSLVASLSGDAPFPPLRTLLRRLLGEAVGIPLPRMLATDGCVLPGWEHACRHEAVSDALTAWMDRHVAPERFTDFMITDAAAGGLSVSLPRGPRLPRSECPNTVTGEDESGGFLARFTSILGPHAGASFEIRRLFSFAARADRASTDDAEADAFRDAWHAGQQLLESGVAASHRERLMELVDELGMIFEDFLDESD